LLYKAKSLVFQRDLPVAGFVDFYPYRVINHTRPDFIGAIVSNIKLNREIYLFEINPGV
jgi:hypothetical protein